MPKHSVSTTLGANWLCPTFRQIEVSPASGHNPAKHSWYVSAISARTGKPITIAGTVDYRKGMNTILVTSPACFAGVTSCAKYASNIKPTILALFLELTTN